LRFYLTAPEEDSFQKITYAFPARNTHGVIPMGGVPESMRTPVSSSTVPMAATTAPRPKSFQTLPVVAVAATPRLPGGGPIDRRRERRSYGIAAAAAYAKPAARSVDSSMFFMLRLPTGASAQAVYFQLPPVESEKELVQVHKTRCYG
jgi:hypothetical protein